MHTHTHRSSGFTLVELAIVLMIIGLLIGGILKGQELITNARIASFMRQVRSYDAAVITFQDSYNALPGDITNPSTRLPNCTATPCSTAGNGNGIIGVDQTVTAENNLVWVHLAAANLISGVDTSRYAADETSSMIPISLGGYAYIYQAAVAPGADFPNGLRGPYWYFRTNTPSVYSIPVNYIARIDAKMDDGKPWTGDVLLDSTACGIAIGATAYGSVSNICSMLIKAGF